MAALEKITVVTTRKRKFIPVATPNFGFLWKVVVKSAK